MPRVPRARDLRGRMLIVAGMSRAGTTYLYHHLRRHPEVFAADRKELCYFGQNFDRGVDWMLSAYAGIGARERALDVCGLYLFMADPATRRIRDFDPEARVVLVLRDPLEWVVSLYEHYSTVWETPPLPEFVAGCTWHREGRPVPLCFRSGSTTRAVETFRRAFGERLLLCDFRLLEDDPEGLLRALETFAGLEPYFHAGRVDATRYNARNSPSAALVRRLARVPGVPWLNSVLPRRMTLGLRRLLESRPGRAGTAPARGGPRRPVGEEERALLEKELDADRRYVAGLFARGPVVDGNGAPRPAWTGSQAQP